MDFLIHNYISNESEVLILKITNRTTFSTNTIQNEYDHISILYLAEILRAWGDNTLDDKLMYCT